MNKLIRQSAMALLALVSVWSTPSLHAQDDAADMPVIMTLKTNIFGYQGPDNNFTIYLGSTEKDAEFYVEGPKTKEYVWVNPYTLGTGSDGSNGVIATAVHLSVSETDNTVTLRGDASKLDYIDVHGCYLSSIELSPTFTNLSVVDMSHNELKEIDLSAFPSLESIDLLDNQFSDPNKMKIGTNHPNLMILSVGINDVIDPELNLRNFPKLQYFSGRNNYGITQIDPSGCPNLVSLVLEVTNITTLDVSKNLNLDVLNISNTKVTSIDLSKNTKLGEFYASHEGSYNHQDMYKLTSIDVTNNPRLQYLDLSGNKLTSIDVTHNPDLLLLFLQRNLLTEIDLSKNTRLATVNLSNNLFTFATLPIPQEGWDYVYYRSPLACNFKYKVDEPIDFSKEVIRGPYTDAQGNTITPVTYANAYGVQRAGETYEIEANKYTYKDGVITFHEAIPDSVYVDFFCTAFPDWTLQSAKFKVKTEEDYDAPSTAFKFTPAASMAGKQVSFKLGGSPVAAGLSLPADIIVKIGEETTTLTGAVTSSSLPTTNNVTFTLPSSLSEVQVLITDGYGATALEIDGIEMTSIDLSEAENLKTLSLTNAALPSIDLAFNGDLRSIDLSNNELKTIDFTAVRGDFEKFYLTDVNLSNNNLNSITMVYYNVVKTLNVSGNAFQTFDFKYYTGLQNIDFSNNKLAGTIDLSTVENLKSLNISNNKIDEIIKDNWNGIQTLNVSNNNLSFATLPKVSASGVTYSYAPQNKFNIIPAGAAVNLTEQNTVNGNATTYVWKYADDNSVVPTNLYTNENGSTKFGETLIGKTLYCEMTNPGFPDFNTQPLTTTDIQVLDKPTNLVASFTTTNTGTAQVGFRFKNNGAYAVYIDWNGDGSQYDEYLYDANNTAIYRTGQSVAGKTAKVYTYGNPADVTCIYLMNTKLNDFDATPMTAVEAIDIHDAGLTDGKFKYAESSKLYELVLDGNNFQTQTFPNLPALSNLNLAGNAYTKFDASLYPNVSFLQLSNNQIEEITFGKNTSLYQLNATNNKINKIDLNGLSSLGELILIDNHLSEIDVTPVSTHLRTLSIEGNYFTFSSLPDKNSLRSDAVYTYGNQTPTTVQCIDGKIDLSSEATINNTETVYRWFLGDKQSDVYYDYYYEMFMGEELEGPDVSSDPEYRVDNGVTSFLYTQKRRVIGALTNDSFPNLILFTTPTAIDKAAGVDNVAIDGENAPVNVYNLSGVRVKTQVRRSEALEGLAPGLYIVGGQKVFVK